MAAKRSREYSAACEAEVAAAASPRPRPAGGGGERVLQIVSGRDLIPKAAWDLSKGLRAGARPRVRFVYGGEPSRSAYAAVLESKRVAVLWVQGVLPGGALPPLPAKGLRALRLFDDPHHVRGVADLSALPAGELEELTFDCCCDTAWALASLATALPSFRVRKVVIDCNYISGPLLRGFRGTVDTLAVTRRSRTCGGVSLLSDRVRSFELRGPLFPEALPARGLEQVSSSFGFIRTLPGVWEGAAALTRLEFRGCRFWNALALPPKLEALSVTRAPSDRLRFDPPWRDLVELRLVPGADLPPALAAFGVDGYRLLDAPGDLAVRLGGVDLSDDRWDLVDLTVSNDEDDDDGEGHASLVSEADSDDDGEGDGEDGEGDDA
ncbi:hypothetical protein JKP88DRAFT_275841 [Tribonema minus]|uniref:Uncharacterized protein n=1 Tax=Tribonema minus TaxID=303371 RepID=A0A835ZC32_9STRA|nr:hypothetical protein JKP88DRAFT_275841 [Tribonema minus]